MHPASRAGGDVDSVFERADGIGQADAAATIVDDGLLNTVEAEGEGLRGEIGPTATVLVERREEVGGAELVEKRTDTVG